MNRIVIAGNHCEYERWLKYNNFSRKVYVYASERNIDRLLRSLDPDKTQIVRVGRWYERHKQETFDYIKASGLIEIGETSNG